MLSVKVPLKDAQKEKKNLIAKNLLDKNYSLKKEKDFVYFPVKEKYKTSYKFEEKELKEKEVKATSIKELLKNKLSKEELKNLKRSMDTIGNIGIIEIPLELEEKKFFIAKEALKFSPQVKTILKKGKHEGVFRTQELEFLEGEKNKIATYKENNIILILDVEKVYFSPRLSNERKRVNKLIKKGEDVLVMFSGCGPYTCNISKNTEAKSITGVEINPEGHKYAEINKQKNKLNNISNYNGDAKEILPKLEKNFDRIIMPLPKSAADFLNVAISKAKKGCIFHFYDFRIEGEEQKSVDDIKEACEKAKRESKVLDIVKCCQSGPKEYRICVDFLIE
jgi:tRNA (guanine37-N1)-methyltransferase